MKGGSITATSNIFSYATNDLCSEFGLTDTASSIKDAIMKKVMESAALSSKNVQGEDFDLEHLDSQAIST